MRTQAKKYPLFFAKQRADTVSNRTQGSKSSTQGLLQPEQGLRRRKRSGQIDHIQKCRIPAGQRRQIKMGGHILNQDMMHKKHRVGDLCQLRAQHTRPRAVQQRGRQRQQDKNSRTGECAGDLAVKAAGDGSTALTK